MRVTNVIIGKVALFNTNYSIEENLDMGIGRKKNKEVRDLVQKAAKRQEEKYWPIGQQCRRIRRRLSPSCTALLCFRRRGLTPSPAYMASSSSGDLADLIIFCNRR